MTDNQKILLIGFGNPARADDGLGPSVAEKIEAQNLPNVTVDSDYQLTVEDSAQVAEYDIVIFADASQNCAEPFSFEPLNDRQEGSFSSHSVEPAQVMTLAEKLFGSKAKAFMLGIRGYEFDQFGASLSEKAKTNMEKAIDFIVDLIKTKNFNKEAACF
ncbi:MAG: hydrogenase maturation protease [Sedimentisphaerales bacterium]|nr:hydrogenase maturation protease [Sedimentisphaerales bacterium]